VAPPRRRADPRSDLTAGVAREARPTRSPRELVADASTAIIVEPGEQTHELVGDRIRTLSKTPRDRNRVDVHEAPRPLAGRGERADRLLALYEARLRSELPSVPGEACGVIQSSVERGDSVSGLDRQAGRIMAFSHPAIVDALGTMRPRAFVPVVITSGSFAALRWIRLHADAENPPPPNLDSEPVRSLDVN
jgi:hypothetical protein